MKILSRKKIKGIEKRMPIFVSHYTIHSPYQNIVKNLEKSLNKFKLDYHIEGIEELGTWRANSNYCIWQVKSMLEKYPDRAILRLDADAIVQNHPTLFTQKEFEADIAAVIWRKSIRVKTGELLGGTLYFSNNERVRRVVEAWTKRGIKQLRRRSGDLLKEIIEKNKDIKFRELPLAYCKIFDSMRNEVAVPVIEHFQASRQYKKVMNKTGKVIAYGAKYGTI